MFRTATKRDTDAFWKHDIEFHRILWNYAGNPYLTRALSQITIPLFAFWTLCVVRNTDVDLEAQAKSHERIAQAVFSGDKKEAQRVTYQSMRLEEVGLNRGREFCGIHRNQRSLRDRKAQSSED